MKNLFFGIICFITLCTLLTNTSSARSNQGKTLFKKNCIRCHSLSKSMNKWKTMDSWKKVVERMRRKKPKLYTKDEGDEIAKYLYSVRGKN